MSEETEKKTEINYTNCIELVVFQITKPLKYCLETKTENKKRIAREETARKKKIWLKMYKNIMGSYALVCKKTNIPKRTFYSWKKNDKEFKEKIYETQDDMIDNYEDRLSSEALNGNVSALKFLLEHNHPKYNRRIKVETYTGDKTLEDLIAEDEKAIDEHNKKVDDELNKEKEKGQSVVHSEHPEDKKQEGEDSPISA